VPFAYDRKTLGVDASWDFMKNSDVKILYEWERFDRDFREVARSTEHTVGTTFDLNPADWIVLRASYKYSERDPEEYTEEEFEEEAFPFGEGDERNQAGVPTAYPMPQISSARKFDQAARNRHQAEGSLQITPAAPFTLGASYGTTQDAYQEKGCVWLGYDQCYGLLSDISYNYTFEFTVDPYPAVSFFAEYTREKYNYRQLSRQRSPAAPTRVANDSPNNDWESNRRDRVDNYAAGLNAFLSDKVVLDLSYSLSGAINKISTRALGDPNLAGFLVKTAQDYPDTSNRWHQMVARVKFPLKSGNFTPNVEYRYERYDRIDFQLVNTNEYFINDPSTVTGIFLGVGTDIPGYRAHILSASLEYRF
jgi:Putative outer membrane beta-barrel porin, MtrB/PioB